jgi:hypothetical protein
LERFDQRDVFANLVWIYHQIGGLCKISHPRNDKIIKRSGRYGVLSWAKPTSDAPEHIKEAAISAIKSGLVGGYSESN